MAIPKYGPIPKAVTDYAYHCATKIQRFNLKNPITYQDKIGWLKTYDYSDLKTYCADKLLLHEYSKDIVGKDLCIPVKQVFQSPTDIDNYQIIAPTVFKCNHGSGYNIIIKNQSQVDRSKIKQQLTKWLNDDFAMRHGEVHYHNIARKCYEETYVKVESEYQFLCFNGIPMFCQAITDRFDKTKVSNNFYDMNFKFIDICNVFFPNNPNKHDVKPTQFDEMRHLAIKFCKPFKLVRVDFYLIDGQIYLGELTFTPGNGHIKFKNPQHDIMLGNMLKLN